MCESASTKSLTGLCVSSLSGDITPSDPSLLPPPRGVILGVPAETIVETRMGGTTRVAARWEGSGRGRGGEEEGEGKRERGRREEGIRGRESGRRGWEEGRRVWGGGGGEGEERGGGKKGVGKGEDGGGRLNAWKGMVYVCIYMYVCLSRCRDAISVKWIIY